MHDNYLQVFAKSFAHYRKVGQKFPWRNNNIFLPLYVQSIKYSFCYKFSIPAGLNFDTHHFDLENYRIYILRLYWWRHPENLFFFFELVSKTRIAFCQLSSTLYFLIEMLQFQIDISFNDNHNVLPLSIIWNVKKIGETETTLQL